MKLKWKNTTHDPLPDHEAHVIIALTGVYYCAEYDALRETFVTQADDDPSLEIPACIDHLYWTEVKGNND